MPNRHVTFREKIGRSFSRSILYARRHIGPFFPSHFNGDVGPNLGCMQKLHTLNLPHGVVGTRTADIGFRRDRKRTSNQSACAEQPPDDTASGEAT